MYIAKAAIALAPNWMERSKLYKARQADVTRVLARTLRRVSDHYDRRCQKSMVEQYFGRRSSIGVRPFESAVFHFNDKHRQSTYQADPVRTYECHHGMWSVQRYLFSESVSSKFGELLRSVDAVMREMLDFGHPIQRPLDTKWILKIIREETQALLDDQKAAEAAKITIDRSQLDKIRRDAAITRDSLLVEEEIEEEPTTSPVPAAAVPEVAANDTCMTDPQYRLLQCLLYGGELSWVKAEGHIFSVLTDGINEALYDTFLDTVLTSDEPPQLLEDYIEELKEMIHP